MSARRRMVAGIALTLLVFGPVIAAERLELVWPTPGTAWADGKPRETFLMHAGTGDPRSGGFGGVRSRAWRSANATAR